MHLGPKKSRQGSFPRVNGNRRSLQVFPGNSIDQPSLSCLRNERNTESLHDEVNALVLGENDISQAWREVITARKDKTMKNYLKLSLLALALVLSTSPQ